ncbi:MAG TPA: HAMP domain-containing sensor histidine kinase [Blastocatellia bacterium]|nr:HAMP domain-containing sensor histidine kinase [Blastocatellia bacterium]
MKTFIKRHFFWAVFPLLMIPLMVILAVQYRSLSAMGQILPLQRREAMSQYLRAVIREVMDIYSANAERTLAVSPNAIGRRLGGVIQDNADRTRALHAVERVADHFKQQQFRGAKRFFIVVETEYAGATRSATLFFDPARQAMVFDPQSPEMRAINVASAGYMIYARTGTPVQPQAMGADRDPNCPLIVKPIVNEEQKVVALAGMVLDSDWFAGEVVPKAIQDTLPKFFPADHSEAVVTLQFGEDQVVYTTRQAGAERPEARMRFSPFYFYYSLSVRIPSLNMERLARRNFVISLALSLTMTLLIAAGLVMALRAASREMRLSQMKTDFVANVSHELRTPLASIRVFSEMLKLGRVNNLDKAREFGSYIESQSRRLTQIINNILDFSRIESGRKSYQFVFTDLRAVVAEVLEICELRLQQSGQGVTLETPDQPMPPVLIDYDAILIALTNLLDNAVKYSKGAKEIKLRLDERDGFATITVKDYGIGVARQEQERIFEKFYRVGTGMVHDVKGAGLGLSIVKHIVEAHHGKITVESELGRGSAFTIHLPMNEKCETDFSLSCVGAD